MNTYAPRLTRLLLFVVFLLVVSLFAKTSILRGAHMVSLQSAPALAASVAPSLAQSDSKGVPVPEKDFEITGSAYFDNKDWVVVNIQSLPDKNPAVVVMEKINGVYTVVLGPGASFSSTTTLSMPQDLANYMKKQGLTY
jgi:hypothetical protein